MCWQCFGFVGELNDDPKALDPRLEVVRKRSPDFRHTPDFFAQRGFLSMAYLKFRIAVSGGGLGNNLAYKP